MAKRPNILLFMTDQEQAQVTDSDHACRTPHLDQLAKEGVRFTQVYPPMAHCCPSRASFMTGLYPSQHGVHNNVLNDQAISRSLNPGVETFSERLRASGYDLDFSGKWHVSATETPQDRGWEELYVVPGRLDEGRRRAQFKEMASSDKESTSRGSGELLRPGWGKRRLFGVSNQTYEETNDYHIVHQGISKLKQLKDSADPWCMYIGTLGPHDPFVVPAKYAKMYDPEKIELPPNYHDDLLDKPGIYRRMRKVFEQMSEYEVKASIAHYWGYCTMLDDLFGEVMETLQRTGQLEDTLIVFLSDHGEHAGAHGLYAKGISHFDEGYRVPCVIRYSSQIVNPGRTEEAFVSITDIAPTLLEAAQASPLNKCSGESLMPFLQDDKPDAWRDSIYTQCNGTELYYTSRMVKTSQYKFVYNPVDMDELYDLENDPHEMCNIAGRPEMKLVVEEMYARMWANAFKYEDTIFNGYVTTATAEYGPAIVQDYPQFLQT